MMTQDQDETKNSVSERRRTSSGQRPPGEERRQFVDSRDHLDPEVRELGDAIDQYKIEHHRRFITLEEILHVVKSLGYHK